MKRNIKWYEECLVNMKASLRNYENQQKDLDCRIERLKKDIELSISQIDRAKKEGLMEFDDERFNIKKQKNLTRRFS